MIMLITLILVSHIISFGLAQNENCYSPDLIPGVCMNAKYCEYILQLIYNSAQNQSATESYLRRSICGYDGVDLLVCCPSKASMPTTPSQLFFFGFFGSTAPIPQTTIPPATATQIGGGGGPINFGGGSVPASPTATPLTTVPANGRFVLPTNALNKCGMTNATHYRVVGGNNAELDGWPWMAILGFRSTADTNPRFQCGGTLITQRHVITAGHCIKDNLYLVRLGEYDLTTNNDGAFPVDIQITWKKAHEEYNSKTITNDIGLIKLNDNAPFTDKIRPICLPVAEPLRSKDLNYYQPFVAGWGATDFKGSVSPILQEVQLPVVPTTECAASYQTLFPGQIFDNRVLCAGFTQGGKDSCQGDSGGPLMLPLLSPDGSFFYWNLIGVVSYGYECARPGFPGVYTRVTTFIPWIENHLND